MASAWRSVMNKLEAVIMAFMGVLMAGIGVVMISGFEIIRLLVERANDVGHALK